MPSALAVDGYSGKLRIWYNNEHIISNSECQLLHARQVQNIRVLFRLEDDYCDIEKLSVSSSTAEVTQFSNGKYKFYFQKSQIHNHSTMRNFSVAHNIKFPWAFCCLA